MQNISSKQINQATQIYYYNLGDKLSYPKIGQQTFWIAFKRIVNTKKQTYIPPIEIGVYIYIYYIYIIYDFLRKANIFNECTIKPRWRYSRYVPRKLLSLCKLFFKNVYSSGTFPNFWKYANIQHISLLPICGKNLRENYL